MQAATAEPRIDHEGNALRDMESKFSTAMVDALKKLPASNVDRLSIGTKADQLLALIWDLPPDDYKLAKGAFSRIAPMIQSGRSETDILAELKGREVLVVYQVRAKFGKLSANTSNSHKREIFGLVALMLPALPDLNRETVAAPPAPPPEAPKVELPKPPAAETAPNRPPVVPPKPQARRAEPKQPPRPAQGQKPESVLARPLLSSSLELLSEMNESSASLLRLFRANKPQETATIQSLETLNRNTASAKQLHQSYLTAGGDLSAVFESHAALFQDVQRMLEGMVNNPGTKNELIRLSGAAVGALQLLQSKLGTQSPTQEELRAHISAVKKAESEFFAQAAKALRAMQEGTISITALRDIVFKIQAKPHVDAIAREMELFSYKNRN